MSRFASILDGAEVADISLAESGFDYFLYVRPGGSGIIMKNNLAQTEYRFYLFGGKNSQDESENNAQAQWDDRLNKDYLRPSALKHL